MRQAARRNWMVQRMIVRGFSYEAIQRAVEKVRAVHLRKLEPTVSLVHRDHAFYYPDHART
jgi:hypothetical protein